MERTVSKIKRIHLNEKPSLREEIKESTEFLLPDKRREKKEYPPKIQMAKNLGESIKKNISTLLKGDKFAASNEKVKMRERICLHCDWFEKKKLRCIKCGCVIPIKIRLEEESCPLNKW